MATNPAQRSVFDDDPPPPGTQPAARASDPHTSHLAAIEAAASGAADRQRGRVLAAVRQHPGRTSRELALLAGLDRHAAARRLPELEARGLVAKGDARDCTAGGRPAVTWWPTEGTDGQG